MSESDSPQLQVRPQTLSPTPRARVGRLHADLNYTRDTKAFDPADVPPHIRATVQSVKATIDLDHLRTRPRAWNGSVHYPRHQPYDTQVHFDKLKFQIRTGLRDEHTPQIREKRLYEGVDTRNDYTRWNVSTETISYDWKKAVVAT